MNILPSLDVGLEFQYAFQHRYSTLRKGLGYEKRYCICRTRPAGLVGLRANDGRATILGTVTDTTGAAIPGAKVVVANTETGFKFDGVTNSDGYYFVPYPRPGVYNV